VTPRACGRGAGPVIGAILALLLFIPAPAAAQDPPPSAEISAKAGAKALAEQGQDLLEAGRHAEAFEKFQQADRLYHAPTIVLLMARTQANLGRLVAARRFYESVIDEPLAADAPPEWMQAKGIARTELTDVRRRLAYVEINVSGAPSDRATLTIDGQPSPGTLAAMREVDPGVPHELVIVADGYRSEKRTLQLAEGERGRVAVRLDRIEEAAPGPSLNLQLPALIAFGAGALGLIVGVNAGVASLVEVGDLDDRCQKMLCLERDRDAASSAEALGTASTVGFILAGTGAAVGATLLYLSRDPGGRKAAGLTLDLGPGSVGLRGRF
jgi:hypothetical protein